MVMTSSQFLQNTLDALTAHVAILDESGGIVEVNDAWKRFAQSNSQCTAGLDVGANYLSVCERSRGKNSEEAAAVAGGIRSVMAGKMDEFRLEYPCHSPKEQRWFIVRVTGFGVNGDRRVVVVHENITERRKAEESLKVSDLALKSISQGVIITDANRLILSSNAAFSAITGYSIPEILGRNCKFLQGPLTDQQTVEAIRTALKNATHFSGEILNYRKDGNTFWNELTISPLWNEHGKLSHFVGVTRDITDRKWAEQVVRQAQATAEASSRAKSEFLANMSHEIRTPMNGIIGMTELTLDTELTASQREYLEAVKVSADTLLTVINDILDFSKIEAGKLDLDPVEFDLRETLDNTLKPLAMRAHQKGLELTCDIANEIPDILVADSVRLRQIWVNLVGNALKFTAIGEIGIEATVESINHNNAVLHFKVTDTGIGIPKEKRERIFEQFSQADGSTTRRYGGSGLGLTISAQLVKLMGGRIWVESEVGRGSTFHFTVSLGISSVQPKQHGRLYVDHLKDLSVLVVDDNATNRRILDEMLKKWGMKPTLAASGTMALTALRQTIGTKSYFQLIIVDCVMPGMDGFSLIEQIQRDDSYTKPVVMMLTSDKLTGDTARCRDLGIACHLVKPVMQAKLLNSILNALGVARLNENRTRAISSIVSAPVSDDMKKLHILLAEDNVVNQKVAVRILERQGHKVEVAENGKEVLKLLESRNFDVVLMDVQMPEMNGFEATACIRTLEKTTGAHVPIIAMTANAMKGDRERCLAEGMDGYISKPIKIPELLEALQTLTSPPPSLKVNDSIVDPKTFSFNADEVLASVDHDFEELKELVRLFVSVMPGSLKAVQEAIAKNDARALNRSSHDIKGTLVNFYAPTAVNAAFSLEKMGLDRQLVEAEATFVALEAAVKKLEAELVSFVNQPRIETKSAGGN